MKRRVIIDTDGGVDDVLALILAFCSSELKIEAITTVFGNVPVEQATKNIIRILDLLHLERTPIIAMGDSSPLKKAQINAQDVHGKDGVGEISRLIRPDLTPVYPDISLDKDLPCAKEVILSTIKKYRSEVTLITLGPLTNIAHMISTDPEALRDVTEIITMGGALYVPGNITPFAEYNIYADPHAAKIVLSSGLPIVLVPLDVTRSVIWNEDSIFASARAIREPVGRFIIDMTGKVMEYTQKRKGVRGVTLHDPLAVGVAIDSSLGDVSSIIVDVQTESIETEGKTTAHLQPDKEGLKGQSNIRTVMNVDGQRFLAFFEERICKG
ncbi:MAG: nucleoside hydrolase [Thermodesulfobacteriota bacterium]|nr:nucleoside hydrolase [Thermodesulfobacteriota bacterium]